MLPHSRGSSIASPKSLESVFTDAHGLEQGLASRIFVLKSKSATYLDCDRYNPAELRWSSMPRNYCNSLSFLRANWRWRLETSLAMATSEFLVAIMSLTYTLQIIKTPSLENTKSEVSNFEFENPQLSNDVWRRSNHTRGACLRRYIDFSACKCGVVESG